MINYSNLSPQLSATKLFFFLCFFSVFCFYPSFFLFFYFFFYLSFFLSLSFFLFSVFLSFLFFLFLICLSIFSVFFFSVINYSNLSPQLLAAKLFSYNISDKTIHLCQSRGIKPSKDDTYFSIHNDLCSIHDDLI